MTVKRILAFALCAALLLCAMPCTFALADTAQSSAQLSMDNYVLKTVYESATANITGSAGNYNYGSLWRQDLGVDATGVAVEDLAIQFSIFYADSEDPTSNAFWETAAVRMFASTEFNAGDRFTWTKEQIVRTDGQPLRPGVWNDVVLPFSIATPTGTFDPNTEKITFVWPEFWNVAKNTWTVKFDKFCFVDMSRAAFKPQRVAALPYDQTFTIAGDGVNKASGFSKGQANNPVIDVSGYNTADLALQLDIEIHNVTNPGSMANFGGWGDARVELTSAGKWDANEINWSFANVNFREGKHTYTFRFSEAGTQGDAIDYSAINYMRAFMVNWPAAMTDTYTVEIFNARIVDMTTEARDLMDNYVVGDVPVANTMTPLASGSLYNYGAWVRDFNINASSVKPTDMAISARLFFMDTEDPDSRAFVENSSGELYISDTFVGENGGTRLVWKTKNLRAADGSELVPGEWNDILLPMTTCYSGGALDIANKPLTFFWWQHYSIPSSTVVVRMTDVRVVDMSRAYVAPEEPTYDTTYLVGEIPFTMDKTVAVGGTFAAGTTFDAIDASAHNPAKLALEIDITATGDVAGMKGANGQIELTSGGTCDKNELSYNIGGLDWEINERTYTVPLSSMTTTGGDIDLSAINYMRMYISGWNTALTGAVTLNVTAVRLVDLTSTEPTTVLPSVFSDGMMFQQNKPMNVFGYGEAGTAMTAELYKGEELVETVTGKVNADGRFDLAFAARAGSYDKYAIRVYGGDLDETVNDILIGELWIAGGQSNMELQIAVVADKDEMLKWNNENVRVFWMPTRPSGDVLLDPARDIKGAYWLDGTDTKVLGSTYVSALAFVFANKLQEQLGVPVGFLNTALGATQIEAWIPREAIAADSALKSELFKRGLYFDEEFWSTSNGTMSTWYNQKVGPLAGLNVAGAIWYQGESNSNRSELYGQELALLKDSWGKAFGYADGNIPFIFTQVAPYRYDNGASNLQHLGYLAENMEKGWALCDPDTTSMITIYDLPLDHMKEDGVSTTNPIHPRVKKPVGERFAAAAMNMVYGGTGEYTAPVYKSMEIKDGAIYVTFDRVGGGLATVDGTANVHGFTIAGADGIYVNADAVLVDADTVKVWNNRVADPKNVTYAFDNFNQGANLKGSAGIPVAPFRSLKLNDTTLKPDASQSYFTAQDWMLADKDVWVYDSTYTQEYATAFRPSFQVTGGKYGYTDQLQKEGTGALRVDFDGNFTVVPILTYESVKESYVNFNSLSVWVMNAGETAVDLALTVNGSTTVGTVTLAPNADKYQLVTFDLSAVDATSFTFGGTAAAAGTLFFDAFSFGMTAAVVDETVLNAQQTALTVDDAAFTPYLHAEDLNLYSPETVAAYNAAVAKAEAVLGGEATLLARYDALTALEAAYNGLATVLDTNRAILELNNADGAVLDGIKTYAAVGSVSAVPVQIPGTDLYGVKMNAHNGGISFSLADIGITAEDLANGQQLAFSVEYYMPSAVFADTRLAMQCGGNTNYILWNQFGGTSWNGPCVNAGTALPRDQVGVATFILGKDVVYSAPNYNGTGTTTTYDSLTDATALINGSNVVFRKYSHGSNPAFDGQDDFYILSVTVFPAERLREVDADDVDYEYIDFTQTVNPYYPEITTTVSKGLKVVEHNTENWSDGTQRFRYYCVAVTDAKSPDGVKRNDVELTIYAKEGSGLKTVHIDAQKYSAAEMTALGKGDGYKYGYSQDIPVVDGVAKVVLEDVLFLNELTSGGSIRIRDTLYDQTTVDGAFVYTDHLGDEVRDIARIELRVLGCDHETVTTTTVEATCTTDGSVTVTCDACGEVISTEVIPATGHDEGVIEGAFDATATAPGYTGDLVCGVCGELLEKGTEIPMKVAEIIDGRYYEDGVKVPYAGLVLVDGNYYYVNDNAKVETGRFFASRFNDFTQFTNGYYYFDENGVMNTEEAVIDGYYYGENGKCESYAGLVEVDGDYYYVLKNGEVKLGRYAIVKHNDLKAKGIYSFGTDGKMLKNVVENGYYYTESGLTVGYLGLVEAADGNLYYVQAQGKVVVNNDRFLVSNHNGLVTKGYYAFDANGAMIR
ncbi:MAG: hypothetical protein E7549_05135 [Ruminococcaceae bacterium]|nr:hypothetical protein [Oscillospiraceae bacterium]